MEYFKKVLNQEICITPDDHITVELFEFLASYPQGKLSILFKEAKVYNPASPASVEYVWDKPCSCGKVVVYHGGKSVLWEALRDWRKGFSTLCPSCQENVKTPGTIETENFISKCLNPNCEWNAEPSKWFQLMWGFLTNSNEKAIHTHVNAMQYTDFLKTPYWKAIAQQIRWKHGFQCDECEEKKKELHVHHKTYTHHGLEHRYLDELGCLCIDCHRKHHGLDPNTFEEDAVVPMDDIKPEFKQAWEKFHSRL